MRWWQSLFSRHRSVSPPDDFDVPFQLYTELKRGAEIRVYPDGRAYYLETVWVAGQTWRLRTGIEIGPFDSAEAAEHAVARSPWFRTDYDGPTV